MIKVTTLKAKVPKPKVGSKGTKNKWEKFYHKGRKS
jgi:hypothetical protein